MRITTTIELRPRILLNVAICLATITVLILLFKHEHTSRRSSRNENLSNVKLKTVQPNNDDDDLIKNQANINLDFDDTFEVDLDSDPVLQRPISSPNDPGQNGKAVNIPENQLTFKDKKMQEEMLNKYQINHFIGDKISMLDTQAIIGFQGARKLITGQVQNCRLLQ